MRFVEWETKAGAAGEAVGQAMGRATAVLTTGLFGAVVNLPEELTVGVSYVAGIAARKKAKLEMHQFLVDHPKLG